MRKIGKKTNPGHFTSLGQLFLVIPG